MVSTKKSRCLILLTVLLATLVFFGHSTVHATGVKKGEAGNELTIEFYKEKQKDESPKDSAEKGKIDGVNKTVQAKSSYLPQTGEERKKMYMVIGLVIIIIVVLLIYKKKKVGD